MDWLVIGSLTGVAVLAGVLGVGTYAAISSDPPAAGAPRAPALVAYGPSRLPINSWAQQASHHQGTATASLARLTVQDVEQYATARPAVPAAPRLNAEPRYQPQPSKPQVVLLPPERPDIAPPPTKSKPALKKPDAEAKLPSRKSKDLPRASPHDDKVMTGRKIAQLRRTLRLMPEQVVHWHAVEVILREIGREQRALLRRGEKPEVATGHMMRLYYAAQPLLGILQPAQKERVRGMARSLGYGNVASML